MKELLTSVFNTCFLNCSCMSISILTDKINMLTNHKYEINVVANTPNLIAVSVGNVKISFMTNDRHVIKSIMCEELNIKTKKAA